MRVNLPQYFIIDLGPGACTIKLITNLMNSVSQKAAESVKSKTGHATDASLLN
jgi:hypothetical protein